MIPKDHSDFEVYSIGEIDFPNYVIEQEISGETRINFRNIGLCKIEVYPGEGQIPHFHLYSIDGKFSTCICIYSNNYFSHGGKYANTFNSTQRKMLNSYLSSPYKNLPTATVWQYIVSVWKMGNPDCKFPDRRKVNIQPDYSNMEYFKDN